MKNELEIIPKPPEQVVLDEIAEKRLEEWVDYFKKLHPRIRVVRVSDDDFDKRFEQAYKIVQYLVNGVTDELIPVDPYEIIGWPNKSKVAFLLSYDRSFPGHEPKYDDRSTYVFCYHNHAFGLNYFHSDSSLDEGEDYDPRSYSLDSYVENALSWAYITSLINERIEEIEQSVPQTP